MIVNGEFRSGYTSIVKAVDANGSVDQPEGWQVHWVNADMPIFETGVEAGATPFIREGANGVTIEHGSHSFGAYLEQEIDGRSVAGATFTLGFTAELFGDTSPKAFKVGIALIGKYNDVLEEVWVSPSALQEASDPSVSLLFESEDEDVLRGVRVMVYSAANKPKRVTLRYLSVTGVRPREASDQRRSVQEPTEFSHTLGEVVTAVGDNPLTASQGVHRMPDSYFPENSAGKTRSKLSIHHMPGGDIRRINDWLALAPEAMLFFGNWGLAQECLPETKYRIGVRNNPKDAQRQYKEGKSAKEAASEFIGWHIDGYMADHAITHWSGHNEPVVKDTQFMEWLAQFEIERMKQMAAIGKRCAIGKFAVGNPEIFLWAHFVPAIEQAHEHGAILLLHEYGGNVMWWATGGQQLANLTRDSNPDYPVSPYADRYIRDEPVEFAGHPEYVAGWLTLRYRQAYQIMRESLPNLPDLPLVIAECGLDIVGGVPDGWRVSSWQNLAESWRKIHGERNPALFFHNQLTWYDDEIRRDEYVKGACIFTYGHQGHQWERFNIAGTPVENLVLDTIEDMKLMPTTPQPIPSRESNPDPDPDPPLPSGNLLLNPSFEEGHRTLEPAPGTQTRNQVPVGWNVQWKAVGDIGSGGQEITATPECRVLHYSKLRPQEHPDGRRPLVLDGEYTYKIFTKHGRFEADFWQQVQTNRPNATIEAEINVQIHWHDDTPKEPDDSHVWVFCGKTVQKYQYVRDIKDRTWYKFVVQGKTDGDGDFVAGVKFFNEWKNSRDIWLDAFSVRFVESVEPEPDHLTVIDVSQHQGVIAWDKVVASGVGAAIIRAGAGVTRDARLEQNSAVLRQNKIPAGMYWAILPNHDAADQGRAFADTYDLHNWGNFFISPWIDCERHGVTARMIVDFINAFELQTNARLGIYTRATWWNPVVPDWAKWPQSRLLWVAHYGVDDPTLPHHWDTYHLHQYTDKGSIDGIKGNVDINRFYGTIADMLEVHKKYQEGTGDVDEPPADYTRRAVLYPPDVTEAEVTAVLHEQFRVRSLWTNTFSADDAGWLISTGAPDSVAYVLEPQRWTDGNILDYLLDVYGVKARVIRIEEEPPPPPPEPDYIEVSPINQRDDAWASLKIGTGGRGKNIGNWGCLLVSYTVWANYMGLCDNWNPVQMNAHMVEAGSFSGPFLRNGALKTAFPNQVNYDGWIVRRDQRMVPKIDAWLAQGIPVPARVDFKPSVSGWQQHWVLLVGKRGDVYVAADPWYGDIIELPERYGIKGVDVLEALFYKLKDDVYIPPSPDLALDVGIHGEEGARWMLRNEMKGASIHAVALGPNATRLNFDDLHESGIDMYVRLNWGWGEGGQGTVPHYGTSDWDRFKVACIETILTSSGVAGWYIGNEPNNSAEWRDGVPIIPEQLAELTNEIYARTRGHNELIGSVPLDSYFGPPHLYSAYPQHVQLADNGAWWIRYLNAVTKLDFLVLHSKTQDSKPANVDSGFKFSHPPLLGRHLHFNAYKDLLERVPSKHRHLTAIIAEANPQRRAGGKNGWDCNKAGEWVHRAFANVQRHNAKQGTQKITAVIFYRFRHDAWTIENCSGALNAIKELAQ